VIHSPCLQEGLFEAPAASDDAEACPAGIRDDRFAAGRQLNAGVTVVGVRDHAAAVARAAPVSAAVTGVVLDIGDLRALGDLPDRQNVSDVEGSGRPALDELPGMDSFGCDDERLFKARPRRLFENELRERCAAPGVVEEGFHNPDNLRRPLGRVDGTELGSTLTMVRVRLEDVPVALALRTKDVAHRARSAITAETVSDRKCLKRVYIRRLTLTSRAASIDGWKSCPSVAFDVVRQCLLCVRRTHPELLQHIDDQHQWPFVQFRQLTPVE
jgi:hypothetical protein